MATSRPIFSFCAIPPKLIPFTSRKYTICDIPLRQLLISRSSASRYRPHLAFGQGNAQRVVYPGARQEHIYGRAKAGCCWFRGFFSVLIRAFHCTLILVLDNLPSKYYCGDMA